MVPPKGGPGAYEAHQGAENDIEAVVAEVGVARRGNVDGHADGEKGQDEQVGWRGGGLIPEQRLQRGVRGVGRPESWRGCGRCRFILVVDGVGDGV